MLPFVSLWSGCTTPVPPPPRPQIVRSTLRYPAFELGGVIEGRLSSCVLDVRGEPAPGRLWVDHSSEGARVQVGGDRALFWDGDGSSSLLLGPGDVRRPGVVGNRLHVDGPHTVVAERFLTPRVVERFEGGERISRVSIPVPEDTALEGFAAHGDRYAFVELDLADELHLSQHRLWITDETGQPLAALELGDYVVTRGNPRCRGARCTIVGAPRHRAGHLETAWVLEPGHEPVAQPLSAGPVHEGQVLSTPGADYALFLEGDALKLARWGGGAWEGVGALHGIARFHGVVDDDRLIVAWAPAEGSWRYASFDGEQLGEIRVLPGLDAEVELVLQPTHHGLQLAAAHRVEERSSGPLGTTRFRWRLSARLGQIDAAGALSLSEPIVTDEVSSSKELILTPFSTDGRGGWLLQVEPDTHRLLRVGGC